MPGTLGKEGLAGGVRLMIFLQLGRGQAIRWDSLRQMSRQLQGHRTYFLPGGAFFIGCQKEKIKKCLELISYCTNKCQFKAIFKYL